MSTYSDIILATAGLVGYWRLGDVSSPAVDLVNGNNGVQSGSPTFGTTGLLPNGDPDKAISFAAASSQFLDITYASTLNVGDTFSSESWIKLASGGSFSSIITQGPNVTGSSWLVNVNTSRQIELWKVSGSRSATSTLALTIGNIYHVVVTKSGASNHIYVNSIDVTGTVTNQTMVNDSTNYRIGGRASVSQFWDGVIDEVALYNTVLTPQQVQQHFQITPNTILTKPFMASVGV